MVDLGNIGGGYPSGAEDDLNAPWNESLDAEMKKVRFNNVDQTFDIDLTNGKFVEIPYIDVLEYYWKRNVGSYEEMDDKFKNDSSADEDFADAYLIKYLKDEKKIKFKPILQDLLIDKGLMENVIRLQIRKIISESIDDNKLYTVYHIQVSDGGKLNYVVIDSKLNKDIADNLVDHLQSENPEETFIADVEGPINSKFALNEAIKKQIN
jgi:hypothetical protein